MSLALSLKPLTFNAVSIDYILYLPWNYSNISCVKGNWEVEFSFSIRGICDHSVEVIEKEQMTWG